MKTVMLLIAVSILSLGGGEAVAMDPEEVSVDGQAVVMPIGRVLLIGREGFVGAVKFLENEKKKDGLYSKYESFQFEKGSFTKIKEGVISLKIPKGFWYNLRTFFFHDPPYSFADKLTFTSFDLFANAADDFHSTVCFWDGAANPDLKVRLAPTPWRDIGEVQLSDPRIRWVGLDKGRERRVTPIDKIWD
jgi:hypothetical protein